MISKVFVEIASIGMVMLAPISGRADSGDGAAAWSPQDFTVAQLAAAWAERQKRVRSGRFVWTQERFQTDMPIRHPEKPPTQNAEAPKRVPEVRSTRTFRFVFAGDDCWSETIEGPAPSRESGELMDARFITACNGETEKSYVEVFGVSKAGAVGRKTAVELMTSSELNAIALTYRPFSWKQVDLDAATINPTPGVVAGRRCLLVEQRPRPGYCSTYWVDPERDFVILRWTKAYRDKISASDEFSYQRDPKGVWVPTGWKRFRPPVGQVVGPSSTIGKVLEYEINGHVGPQEFEFTFPPGTWVVDKRSGEEYIVRPGGGKRIILREELNRGATYRDFLETETGQGGVGRKQKEDETGYHWIYVAGVAVIVAAPSVVLLGMRRGRRG